MMNLLRIVTLHRSYRCCLIYNLDQVHSIRISARRISKEYGRKWSSKEISHNEKLSLNAKQPQNFAYKIIVHRLDELRQYTTTNKLILAFVLISLAALGTFFYMFPDEVHAIMATQVSTVASKSLEDNELLEKAGQLSKEVLNNVLHDKAMKEQTAQFVTAILTTTETKNATANLLMSVLQDPVVTQTISDKLKSILLQTLTAEDTKKVVLSQTVQLLRDESMKVAVQDLLRDVTASTEVQDMFADFFKKVLSSKVVTDQGNELGKQITESVISDKNVQQQAGSAIWAAMKYSVTPRLLLPSSGEGSHDEAE